MNALLKYLLAFALLAGLAACGDDDDGDGNGNNPLPDSPSLTATIDNGEYSSTGSPGAGYSTENNLLVITSVDADSNTLSLTLSQPPGTTGSFPTKLDTPNAAGILFTPAGQNTFLSGEGSGTITLNTYADGIVSGTFSGTIYEAVSGDSIVVSDGVFTNIPYTTQD